MMFHTNKAIFKIFLLNNLCPVRVFIKGSGSLSINIKFIMDKFVYIQLSFLLESIKNFLTEKVSY